MADKKVKKKTSRKVVAQQVNTQRTSKSTKKTQGEIFSKFALSNKFNKISSPRTIIILGVAILIVLGYLIFKWLVIAWVDGKPVTRVELLNQLEKRYGSDTKEQIISEKLILDEASRRNLSVSDDQLGSEIKKTEDQVGGHEALQSLLQQQKISESDFHKQIKIQLLIQKMFDNEASVSSQEVDKYIEDNKNNLAQTTDSAKLKNDVQVQLKQQKLSDVFRTWLQETLKSTRVIRM